MERFLKTLLQLRMLLNMGMNVQKLIGLYADAYHNKLIEGSKYKDSKRLNLYERRVFSQNGEDGIIEEIFRRIGTNTKTFLEIGIGDGDENNTVFLLFQGWKGFWIESNQKSIQSIKKRMVCPIRNGHLNLIRAHLKAENVSEILKKHNIPSEVDLFSLDIDRNTYWIWAALTEFIPRVVVVEYNALLPPFVDWKVVYDSNKNWDGTAYFGASLKAYELLGRKLGYRLVGCDLVGVNAFFIREDLCGDEFEAPFTAENHYEPARYYLIQNKAGYKPGFE